MLGAQQETPVADVSGQEIWKRFTPVEIDQGRCLVRTWVREKRNDGRGGQFANKPQKNSRFCGRHQGKLAHGSVDGEIPEDKLKAFLKAEERRRMESGVLQRVRGAGFVAGGAGAGDPCNDGL